MEKSRSKIIGLVLASFILVVMLVINILCGVFARIIDFYLCTPMMTTDTLTREEGASLAKQIEQEGIVLAKNDACLPLNKSRQNKVNVFGWASTHWVKSGDGSGRVTYIETDFLEAFQEYGIETNSAITQRYNTFRSADRDFAGNVLGSLPEEFYRLYEPSIQDASIFSSSLLEEAKEYSNTAMVVLGRVAGESSDAPKTQYKQNKKNGAIVQDTSKTYLDISTEEEELLTYVGKNYENVIVVINSTNTMNLEFMDRIQGLDACLIVGATGGYGASVIPQVIYGDINPSGRTTDIYAYDFSTNPVYVNSGMEGEGSYTNGSSLYPYNTINSNTGKGQPYGRVSYVDYAEGIYVGYKWYETADAENYFEEVDNQYGKGYEGVVQYPFGYGLSYTTFEWELMNISLESGANLARDSEIAMTVRVTNTGKKAGKEVVELYYTPPYNKGGIEKSAVNLCAFAKTPLINPGEYTEVTLKVKAEDMASYDMSNGGGYVLEKGTYYLKLMKNSHEFAPMKNNEAVCEYVLHEDCLYKTDSYSGNAVGNKFTGDDALDGVALDGSDSGANITYLSRANFKGTFPAQLRSNREMTQNVMELNLISEEEAKAWINPEDEEPTMGAKNGLLVAKNKKITQLGLELGKDFNDERWEDLLDQLTLKEMTELTLHATYYTKPLASIGMTRVSSIDGPSQYGSWGTDLGKKTTAFPMPTVLAQTWNTELSYSFGLAVGKEAVANGYDGWYGPGINLHRSPFGGRNYEYYSEDGYLSGTMCAQTIIGAKNRGVFCFIKHLCLYNQESMRDGLYTWLTEQALRETYLKSFKIAIQQGGATALMSGYNRIGATWTGGSYALITGIIREEFGFNGTIITDYADHHEMMNGDAMMYAGGDIWMDGFNGTGRYKLNEWKDSNTFKQNMRLASKHTIYAWLNALYTNSIYNERDDVEVFVKPVSENTFSWWIPVLIGLDVLAIVGCYFILRKQGFFKKAVVDEETTDGGVVDETSA